MNSWVVQTSLRLAEDESLTDPLTGLGGRAKLLADLVRAVGPRNRPSLLAIVYFEGFGGKTRRRGDARSRVELVERCTTLARALGPVATCYRLREPEFAALIACPAAEAITQLELAVAMVEEPANGHIVTFGTCRLPEEAAEPAAALGLAGERLTERQRSRESRERRLARESGVAGR